MTMPTGTPIRGPQHSSHRHRSYYPRARAQADNARAGTATIGLSRRQLVVGVLLTLIGGWLAFHIVAGTAAQKAAVVKPDVALAWNSGETSALDELARRCLAGNMKAGRAGARAANTRTGGARRDAAEPRKVVPAHDGSGTRSDSGAPPTEAKDAAVAACDNLDRAEALARRALQKSPLDVRALTLLGLIAERKGDAARASSLMRVAATRTWRDPTTQVWLFNEKIKKADFAGALQHADAILRTGHDFDRLIFPSLAAFTLAPQPLQALVTLLNDNPPWRSWFLGALSARLANDTRLVQIYRALLKGKNPPDTDDLKALFARLIKDHRYDVAYGLWRDVQPSRRGDRFPYNADFSHEPNGLPFDWVLRSVPGADIGIVPLDGGEGRALRVQFSGRRVNFRNVYQLIRLPPGDYRLSGKMKAENLRTRRGLRWQISCADVFPVRMPRSLTALGHTQLLAKAVPWRDFGVDFTVPKAGCPAQWLVLELAARIGPEWQIEGEAWFTSLRIVPASRPKEPGPMCVALDAED